MCNCNTPSSPAKQEFVVTAANGQEKVFDAEPEARIYATLHNGRVTVKKK